MKIFKSGSASFFIVSSLFKWLVLLLPLSVVTGSVVALFLWLLDKATATRIAHPYLLYLLPVAGVLIFFLYRLAGKNVEAGNNLVIDEIHEPGGGVPGRMAPLVLFSTLVTHLFGGSAGREGTAVQMGGSFASVYARWHKLDNESIRILLMAGIAAGFGAVFGTPLAGAVFAAEVLHVGKIDRKALLPCFAAALIADRTCTAWGIHHTSYQVNTVTTGFSFLHVDPLLLFKALAAGMAFGLAAYLFSQLSHTTRQYATALIRIRWLTPVIGGVLVIGLTWIVGNNDYLGLGVTHPNPTAVTISSAFTPRGAQPFSWLWKILFTAVTLGFGFKGGEVTPLFFIGATLGNVLAIWMGAPVDLVAGLGFIAVFAGATNTPIACTLMGVELFGPGNTLYYAAACAMAYFFSGHSGIYGSQRISRSKFGGNRLEKPERLSWYRKKHR